MIKFNDPIPKILMKQFQEILYSTGGKYFNRPRYDGDFFRIDYIYGDKVAHQAAWKLCLDNIKDVRQDHWIRIIFKKMIFLFREIKIIS